MSEKKMLVQIGKKFYRLVFYFSITKTKELKPILEQYNVRLLQEVEE